MADLPLRVAASWRTRFWRWALVVLTAVWAPYALAVYTLLLAPRAEWMQRLPPWLGAGWFLDEGVELGVRAAALLLLGLGGCYLPWAWTRSRADLLELDADGLRWHKTFGRYRARWSEVVRVAVSRHRRIAQRRFIVEVKTLNPWKRYCIIDHTWDRFTACYDVVQERSGTWVEKSPLRMWGF